MTRRSAGPAAAAAMGGVPAQLAIMVVDDDRRCLEANLAACRLLGLPRRAVVGRTFDDFLAAGMRSRVDHVWRAFREGGGHAGPFELSSQAAATEEVHITVTANVLPGRHLLILSGGGAQIEEPEGASRSRPARRPPTTFRASPAGARPRASARSWPCSPPARRTSRSRDSSSSRPPPSRPTFETRRQSSAPVPAHRRSPWPSRAG